MLESMEMEKIHLKENSALNYQRTRVLSTIRTNYRVMFIVPIILHTYQSCSNREDLHVFPIRTEE